MQQQQDRHARGFSLVELMVALVVLAITLGIGAPSVFAWIANNRMSSAANDLVTSLHAARSEALKRQAPISLCATPDGAGPCDAGGNFGDGWTVFVDRDADGIIDADDTVLQRHGALDSPIRDRVESSPVPIRFGGGGTLILPDGVAGIDIQLCDERGDKDTGGGIAAGRWIRLSNLGRPTLFREREAVQEQSPLGGC